MAITFTTTNGTQVIPGSTAAFQFQRSLSGLATTGIIALLGEAESGAGYADEAVLNDNRFGPGQRGALIAKYGAGPIIDAFDAAVAPSNDGEITGSPAGFVIVKTNAATRASGAMVRTGLTDYATVLSTKYGKAGNDANFKVSAATGEVIADITVLPAIVDTKPTTFGLRINGGAETLITADVDDGSLPVTLTAVADLAGIAELVEVTGGAQKLISTKNDNITVTGSGNDVTIVNDNDFVQSPAVGDMLFIPDTSPIEGASKENVGSYLITGLPSAKKILATKFRDAAVAATSVTPPAASTTGTIGATKDLVVYEPVVISGLVAPLERPNFLDGLNPLTLALAAPNNQTIVLTLSDAWQVKPAVGDMLQITAGDWDGPTNANIGWYSVTSTTNTKLTATRITAGTTEPVAAPVTIDVPNENQIKLYRYVQDGFSKAVEIKDANNIVFDELGAKTIVSTDSASVILTPDTEYSVRVEASSGSTENEFVAGGEIGLTVGFAGTTATATITATAFTTSKTGGPASATNLNITFPAGMTIKRLVDLINAQVGYSAATPTLASGNLPVTSLDKGTFGICGAYEGSQPGRIKTDAYRFAQGVSGITAITITQNATAGLPEVQATTELTGGSIGGTSNTNITDAFTAMNRIRCNFVVPCFSRDATADIADGLTDATSTYTIDSINALLKSHVLFNSAVRRRRNRSGIASKRGTFAQAKAAAQNLASARVSLTFQDVKTTGEFKFPYLAAANAAGLQTAGFYKAFFNKLANINGVVQAAGDFDPGDQDQLETALLAGLLTLAPFETGGYGFVSDQTTYSLDDNFGYNSIQAMYVADIVAMTSALRMERRFVGSSLADSNAGTIANAFATVMRDFKRLKLVTASDGAPQGFKNLRVTLDGPVAEIACDVYLATALYFVPIEFSFNRTQSQATA